MRSRSVASLMALSSLLLVTPVTAAEKVVEIKASTFLPGTATIAQGDSWDDPRAAEPWERAAALVVAVAQRRTGRRASLLALASDLLSGPRIRIRGIRAERILEGMLARRLA